MHVGAKKIATAGFLVAFSVVMMFLSSAIEASSLFFIAAASFCVGIAVREWGLKIGVAFFIASSGLNFLVTPNKLYCFTLVGMSAYIWTTEWLWKRLADGQKIKNRMVMLWVGKYVVFNLLYVPTLFLAPRLLFAGKLNGISAIILLLLGQVVLYIYDMAYRYFQAQVWGRLRGKLFIK